MALRTLVLSLVLMSAAGVVMAQPASVVRAFEEGNRLYAQGRHAQALAAYEQAEASGYASGALFYNMGSTYYRAGALGQALRYYEKAEALGLPETADRLEHNLSVLRGRLSERARASATERPPFWLMAAQRLTAWVRPGWFFAIGLALYLGALGVAAWRLWTGRRLPQPPWLRRTAVFGGAGGLVLIGLAFAAPALDAQAGRRAVVIAEAATVRAAPADTSAAEGSLPEGFVVRVRARRGGWVRVAASSSDSLSGWLPARAVGEI